MYSEPLRIGHTLAIAPERSACGTLIALLNRQPWRVSGAAGEVPAEPRRATAPAGRATAFNGSSPWHPMHATPIPTNDLWIAAMAVEYGLALFTRDRHVADVPGLAIL